MKTSSLVPTIIIIEDPMADQRGYSLVDREFFLKEPHPRKEEAVWLDGTKFTADYYVLTLAEYVRVVPEARDENYNWTKEILIPKELCVYSLKPCYAK